MRIALTGATGFIGTPLFQYLQKKGHTVIGISRRRHPKKAEIVPLDLTKTSLVRIFFREHPVDCIIHLAAKIPTTTSGTSAKKYLWGNVTSTRNLLAVFKSNRVKKFIYASSIAVIGTPLGIVDENSPINPENPYAASKHTGELLAEQCQTETKKQVTVLRITAPYGPGQRIPTVISKFIHRAMKNQNLIVQGSGSRIQNFIYIDDVVHAFSRAVQYNRSGLYIIGGPQSLSTLALAKKIIRHVRGTTSRILFRGSDVQEHYSLRVNLAKAKKELGYSPQFTVDKGLTAYINFLKNDARRDNI